MVKVETQTSTSPVKSQRATHDSTPSTTTTTTTTTTAVGMVDADKNALWTEKYRPRNSKEVVGNENAVKKVHQWLAQWTKDNGEKQQQQRKAGKGRAQDEENSDDGLAVHVLSQISFIC